MESKLTMSKLPEDRSYLNRNLSVFLFNPQHTNKTFLGTTKLFSCIIFQFVEISEFPF